MESFDYWINKEGFNFRPEQYDLYKYLYEAGQQSKQAEVDELKRELLNKTNEAYADGQRSMRKMIKSNEDELRKRIDSVIVYLDGCDSCCDISKLHLIEVLQGDQS